MKAKAIICVIAALSMGISGSAFAQQDKDRRADEAGRIERGEQAAPHRQDRRPPPRPEARRDRGDRRDHNGARGGDRHGDYRRDDYRRDDYRGQYYRNPPPGYGYSDGRGAGPNHSFYRGGRLPPEWRSRQYVVDDWRDHRLSAPPRGYHWVQTGGDYVLIAIATGIIASILLSQ